MEYKHVEHGFGPVRDKNSRILILGSFPSVLSRQHDFYYANPQNRFWKVLERLLEDDAGLTKEERTAFCYRHGIALYDVIESCDIVGSSDSSIKNVVPSDIESLIKGTQIKAIVLNGNAAKRYFLTYFANFVHLDILPMPSTSPANAVKKLEDLMKEWSAILKYL